MKRRLLVISIVLGLSAGWGWSQAVNKPAVEKQIMAYERAINDAFVKTDVKAFMTNIAPDAIGIDMAGISKVNPAEMEKMMKAAKIQSWNIDNAQYIWVNDNTVIIMYRWTGKGTYQGQPLPSPTFASTVWANRGGKWLAVFHQETAGMPMPAPAPASGNKK